MDFGDEPAAPQSIVPTILYGATVGALLCAIFFLSYLVAPDLPIEGTTVIALAVVAAAIVAVAYATRGDPSLQPPVTEGSDAVEEADAAPPSPAPSPAEVLEEEMEAQLASLRETVKKLDRTKRFAEWADKMIAVGALHQTLAQHQSTQPETRGASAALANYRMASNMFRRVADARVARRFPRLWVRAQTGFGECMLVLGSVEESREHLQEAASSFASVLEDPQLETDERDRATAGLQRAEAALAGSAEEEVRTRDDVAGDLF